MHPKKKGNGSSTKFFNRILVWNNGMPAVPVNLAGAVGRKNSGSALTQGQTNVSRLVQAARDSGAPDGYAGKRGWMRFKAGLQLELTLDPVTEKDVWSVMMHNVSGGGASFWCKRELPLHAQIYIRYWDAEDPIPWTPAKVVHLTLGIRGYLIGIRFDEAAPRDQVEGT